MHHIVLTRLLGCSLLLALVGCDPDPADPSDGSAGDVDGDVDHDGGPEIDGGDPEDVDASLACDCCGTTVDGSGDAGLCSGGVCDAWCGHVIPCDDSCDRTTHVCVFTYGGADAGPPPDGGAAVDLGQTECVPRPSACDDLANCGGPSPDPSCDMSDPCFDALECAPNRVIHRGFLVQCRGA